MNTNPHDSHSTGKSNRQRVNEIRNRKILILSISVIICMFLAGGLIYQTLLQRTDGAAAQHASLGANNQRANESQGSIVRSGNTQKTIAATKNPTQVPIRTPTKAPTQVPTRTPTKAPTQVPTKAPTHVPTQAPTARPVNRASISNSRNGNTLVSEIGSVVLSDYGASSELTDQYGAYTVSNCFDRNINTTWAEGESGDGIGSTISGSWSVESGSWQITGIAIWAGYHKSSDVFYKNSRPRNVTLEVYSDGEFESFEVSLSDSESCQYILFDYPINLRSEAQIWLTINSVYSGNKYTDTCITDIDLLVQ